MNLTQLVRKLEKQLKTVEKYARDYDSQADDLRDKLANIARIVGKRIEVSANVLSSNRGGKISAAGRARIIAAQRKRWAAFRSKNKGAVKSVSKSKKGRAKLSAAGRAKIAAAQKKRWASFRKGK
jgi:hypothetical protein